MWTYCKCVFLLQLQIITDKGTNDVWIKEAQRSGTWWSSYIQSSNLSTKNTHDLGILGWCSTNWATEAAQVAEFQITHTSQHKAKRFNPGENLNIYDMYALSPHVLFSNFCVGISVVKAVCPTGHATYVISIIEVLFDLYYYWLSTIFGVHRDSLCCKSGHEFEEYYKTIQSGRSFRLMNA